MSVLNARTRKPPPLYDSTTPRIGGSFERVTVNLTEKTSIAFAEAVRMSTDSRTDVINKALQTYAMLLAAQTAGGAVYMRESDGAELERVRLL